VLQRGVSIFEGTRAEHPRREGDDLLVATAAGRVRARSVVLATGPALAGERPLRRRMTVTSSHIVITEPVPDVLEELGWTGGECITDSRTLLHYFRTTRDHRIAFGWGGGRVALAGRLNGRAELDPDLVASVERDLVRFFPPLAGRRIEHAWGGPIDVSPTHLPMIGSLGDRVHYAVGYTGNGVGPSHLAGRILASLALGRRDDTTSLAIVDSPPGRVPPEPLRYLGGTVVRRALIRRERFEEQGRRADPLTRFIAGLPERIGIHVGR
jgi:glycine/D-amino acid oxidase-like deaminating enzyme